MGTCEECGSTDMGAVDLSVGMFYCNACWKAFAPGGDGEAGEGGEGLGTVDEGEEGGGEEEGGGDDENSAVPEASSTLQGGPFSGRYSIAQYISIVQNTNIYIYIYIYIIYIYMITYCIVITL